jgi:hypothetical protein
MSWQEEFEREMALLADNLVGPGKLYMLERHFWLDLWRVPIFEAVDEEGIEVRHYGPIRAFVIADEPRVPLFNLMLGATAPGVVKQGHLAAALDWTESLGVNCRIPVRPDFGEPDAVEDHLNQRGYRRSATLAMFVRGGEPPDFPEPPGIEVDEITEEIEGFNDFFAEGDPFWAGNGFYYGLPVHRYWRCYIAVDAKNEEGIGAATMRLHYEAVAQLGFAATYESARGKGAHMALLRRRIVDALAAGRRELFAVTEEPLDYPASQSAAAANLIRAGFRLASLRTVWRPPEELLAQDDDEDEDELDEDEGPDEDHDFELES